MILSGFKIFLVLSAMLLISACGSAPKFTKNNEKTVSRFPSAGKIWTGTASYYADEYHGRKTANGEIYDMNKLTAAHTDLPFNTIVKVTNLKNSKTVTVRINDRMPEFKNRVIDLSYGAAKVIDMVADGIVEVRLEILEAGK